MGCLRYRLVSMSRFGLGYVDTKEDRYVDEGVDASSSTTIQKGKGEVGRDERGGNWTFLLPFFFLFSPPLSSIQTYPKHRHPATS